MENEKVNIIEDVGPESERTEKIEKERQELLNKVLSGNLETIHDRVGFILNNNSGACTSTPFTSKELQNYSSRS